MSHHATGTGRAYVECDEVARDHQGVPTSSSRCGRRSYGRLGRLDSTTQVGLFDLPRGWSVAPYPDDFDHGLTRTSLLDGSPIPPIAHHLGLRGDLHTCPAHRGA